MKQTLFTLPRLPILAPRITAARRVFETVGSASFARAIGVSAGAMVTALILSIGLWGAEPMAQPNSDQGEARKDMHAGKLLSLRQIERRILPTMRNAEYLGPAYDSTTKAYRLKFIRNGRVLYIDVDARTGKILRRSGRFDPATVKSPIAKPSTAKAARLTLMQ